MHTADLLTDHGLPVDAGATPVNNAWRSQNSVVAQAAGNPNETVYVDEQRNNDIVAANGQRPACRVLPPTALGLSPGGRPNRHGRRPTGRPTRSPTYRHSSRGGPKAASFPTHELSQQRNYRSCSHHGEPKRGCTHDKNDDENAHQKENDGANTELIHGDLTSLSAIGICCCHTQHQPPTAATDSSRRILTTSADYGQLRAVV
ncbi:hypothetical protein OH807_37640 [Kitasatospora sp. NBC_01560]|uniref:hypothetical protein n=1 Tax=Kitasatospora sp. NBC_01560 TaxID=2975965 RepID=UPI0038651CE1